MWVQYKAEECAATRNYKRFGLVTDCPHRFQHGSGNAEVHLPKSKATQGNVSARSILLQYMEIPSYEKKSKAVFTVLEVLES